MLPSVTNEAAWAWIFATILVSLAGLVLYANRR